jgi:uncharacterized membrane protein
MSARLALAVALVAAVGAACAAGAAVPAPGPALVVGPRPKLAKPTCAFVDRPVACEGAPPTFDADVRPILKRRCLGCHGTGGVASEDHDFSTEEHVRAARQAIASRVSHCAMPPAGASPLADEEGESILRWIACAGE